MTFFDPFGMRDIVQAIGLGALSIWWFYFRLRSPR
jgi:hypothetical protein